MAVRDLVSECRLLTLCLELDSSGVLTTFNSKGEESVTGGREGVTVGWVQCAACPV